MELLTLYRNEEGVTVINENTLKKEEYNGDTILNFIDEAKDLIIVVHTGIWDINYVNNTSKECVSFRFVHPSIDQFVIENNKLVGISVQEKTSLFFIDGILLLNGDIIGKIEDEHQSADSVSDPSYFENDEVIHYYLGKYPSSLDELEDINIDGLDYFRRGELYLNTINDFILITR